MPGIVERSRKKSPWLFHINTGSCNGCDIEIMASLAPRYDVERLGCVLVGSPKHADVILVTGPVTRQMYPRLMNVYRQVPEPKAVVVVGSCATSGDVYAGSHVIEGPVDVNIPVDVYVVGCPPRPEAILKGVAEAVQKKFGG